MAAMAAEALAVRGGSRKDGGRNASLVALRLNKCHRRTSLGQGARKRGSKATYTRQVKQVSAEIWKRGEQACGKLLKPTIPLWLDSYETQRGKLPAATIRKIRVKALASRCF
jgi:hypothetical protein